MNNPISKMESYQRFWSESVALRFNDQSANNPTTISFDDYIHLANQYGFNDKLAIAPLWVADDAVAYGFGPGMDTNQALQAEILLPVSLFAYYSSGAYSDNGYRITIPFGNEIVDCPVTEDEMSTYDSHYSFVERTIVYPFRDELHPFQNQQHAYKQPILLDELLERFQWIGSYGSHYSPVDVRMCIYMLSKKIKTSSTTISVLASTLTKYVAMADKFDRDVFAPLHHEMQKAILVKMILNNPYVRSNILIY